MPVTLESRARRIQVFHLPHDVFCRDRCACAEVTVVVVAENPRTGDRAPKHMRKKVPSSLTFLALERKPGLPSTLLEVAEVKAAIGRGYLRIVEQTSDKPAAPTAAESASSHSPAPAASELAHSPAPTTSAPQSPALAANALAHAPAPAANAPSHSPSPASGSPPQPPTSATNASSPPPAAKPPGKEP